MMTAAALTCLGLAAGAWWVARDASQRAAAPASAPRCGYVESPATRAQAARGGAAAAAGG